MTEQSTNEHKQDIVDQVQRLIHLHPQHESRQEVVHLLQQLLTPTVCRRLGLYPIPDDFLLSVIVPVFNEVQTVTKLVDHVLAVPIPLEIILVDDGSTDGTRDLLPALAEQPNVRVVLHEQNRGKGAALRTGLIHAQGDVVVFQDADLEYDPSEYPLLLLPILEGHADAVFGSQFSSRSRRVPKYWHSTINRLITLLSNMRTNLKLTDVETCYKLMRREIFQQLGPQLREDGFGIEIEITAKLAKLPGIRIHELPIGYQPRSSAEGKKIGWRDGIRALWCILRY